MADAQFTLNRDAVRKLLTSDEAFDADLKAANRVCDAANQWAEAKPRSGAHAGEVGPHFWVVAQPSKNRARYVVAPKTGFGYWLTRTFPAEFMACLGAGG